MARWMKNRAYGMPDPGPDDWPTVCRSSALEQCKKAVSWFMPNKHMQWNVQSNCGNPTKSVPANDVIKDVKLAEVRKKGKKSCVKRDIKKNEFKKTVHIAEAHKGVNSEVKTKIPVMMKLQFSMIGRTDDITNLETNDLSEHHKFSSFALQTKVSWSKNLREERD